LFSGDFTAEEVQRVGNKESGGTTIADLKTLLEVFLSMSQRSLSLIMLFSDKQHLVWEYTCQVMY